MRGQTVKSPQVVAQAQAMRAQGMTQREIGEHFGVTAKAVSSWLTDPDGSRLRARKDSYTRECIDCSGPCSGTRGTSRSATRCVECAVRYRHATRRWTPETIIAAIQRWASAHDGTPPCATDWHNGGSRPEWAPTTSVVLDECSSWNAAIRAAGYEPMGVGHHRTDRTREWYLEAIQRWVREHGEPPRRDEWAPAVDGYPSASGVEHRFGTWTAAIRAAGFEPHHKHFPRRAAEAA